MSSSTLLTERNEDNEPFHVVTDFEERYSIWPQKNKIPAYWKKEGFSGSKKECLDYIQNVWTDMRPLSLRKEMALWEEDLKKRQPSPETLAKMAEEREKASAKRFDYFSSNCVSLSSDR
jgi:MbtH protein